MKRIKEIGRLLFSFRGRILRNKWLVAVGLLVFFNVWQANEISDLKKRVRLHNFQMAHEPIQMAKALVYIREGGEHYHRKGCRTLLFTLADKIPIEFLEAKEKYDPCPVCKPATKEFDAMMDTTMAAVEKEEREFAARVERALRRLRDGHPLPRY